MFSNSPRSVPVLFTLLLAGGCSPMGGGSNDASNYYLPESAGNNPIKIESEPSGAEVFAMGEKIGITPLAISPKNVFPTTYPKEKEPLYGKVTLKKSGCSDLTKTVSTKIANVGLRAQLECGGLNPAPPQRSRDTSVTSETAEQRLVKIKNLLDKGLITEEEAKKARERILNDL